MRLAARRPVMSIVVPVYDEEGNVEPLHRELVTLADDCLCDPDRAPAAWLRLKRLVT